MNLLDRLLGRDDDPAGSDDEPDAWTVRWYPAEGRGGWQLVDGYERLERPIDRETFQWNNPEADLDPGRYRLFALDGTRLERAADDIGWGWRVEADEADARRDDQHRQIMELLDDIEEILETDETGRDVPDDPEELLKWRLLHDEDFLHLFGDDIALDAWDIRQPRKGGLGFDEFRKSPWGALIYDITHNPEQFQAVMFNVGAGLGKALRAVEEGGLPPEDR